MITEYLHMNGIYAWELKKVKEEEMIAEIYEHLLDLRIYFQRNVECRSILGQLEKEEDRIL